LNLFAESSEVFQSSFALNLSNDAITRKRFETHWKLSELIPELYAQPFLQVMTS